ncbi:MAG: serine/threonine-protein kinase [Planctomycetota bacterium]|nr:serine/threonine-protein kinase [Planctomycetota bacterium]
MADRSAQELGGYRIVRKLGEGGMGMVYEAIQPKLKRKVALKTLLSKWVENSDFLTRFYREAQSAAALNHPNIVQIYDIGDEGGTHFFAMEFVDGESVHTRLNRAGKIPLNEALNIAESVAIGLRHAHAQGVIHRDIKPDNIMVSHSGEVKLADLGLAKQMDEALNVTQTGAGIGTPYYMAPEQAEDARNVDHRADIYALGVSLLHMLTDQRPFDGNSAYGIIIQHREKELPSAEELGTQVPKGVEALIRKMCAKHPDERHQDYDSLLSDIETVRAGQPPVSGSVPRQKTKGKTPTAAAVGTHEKSERIRELATEPDTTRGRRGAGIGSGTGKSIRGRLIGPVVILAAIVGVGILLRQMWHPKNEGTQKRASIQTQKITGPSKGSSPPENGLIPKLKVCKRLEAKRSPLQLMEGAIRFTAPRGDGRGGANGFLIRAGDKWKELGTEWRFRYERSGSAWGIQVIHPWKTGHIIVLVHPGVRILPGGRWAGMGWYPRIVGLPAGTTPAHNRFLPVKAGVSHQITSRLDGQGNYSLHFDEELLVEAKADFSKPLSLDVPEGVRPPGTGSWGQSGFVGDGLPRDLALAEAGLIVGPRDSGTNAISDIWFAPAMVAADQK